MTLWTRHSLVTELLGTLLLNRNETDTFYFTCYSILLKSPQGGYKGKKVSRADL